MDYVLVSYFVATRTAISYAVGEWAKIWPLQTLIKSLGAYFVRRKSGNPLYRKVLERYVQMATEAGVTQAIFLEGKLSMDGKLCPPKMGLLDYILRGYHPENRKDLIFIPVAINYDRTLEDRSLLLASGDKERKGASIFKSLRISLGFISKVLLLRFLGKWYRFGYACVNFGTPVSTREYIKSLGLEFPALEKEDRFRQIEDFANHLMGKIAEVIPVLPVALVSKVMIENMDHPISEFEIKAKIFEVTETYKKQGIHIYIPRNDMDYAIQVGLRILRLRRVITDDGGGYQAAPGEEAILKYYANSLAHYDR
ncbi:MAG: 1-acyl-sn-glycerol-3-phosphate acyltransferase [Deltaproteobacteria bacterium]|nr:1-acyl-sn-glycerol-3-phosphate acyltransferase [Deltaproteobacteria bacterium]